MHPRTLIWLIVLAALIAFGYGLINAQEAHSAEPGAVLVIKGSDSMLQLSQAWAETYLGHHEDRMISVTGGGSGTGIAAFVNRQCDIANLSRPLKESEIQACRKAGREPKMVVCGLDGLAVVVNAANPLKKLEMGQIGAIFRGEITDWAQVGGKPGKILVFSRENNSGTHQFFREHVMGNQNYPPETLMMPSTQALANQVAVTPAAIGYGGEAYFRDRNDLRILAVSAGPGKTAYYPTEVNVISRRYPISRELYMLVDAKPSAFVKHFLSFCLSYDGQCVVRHSGYVPLPLPLPPAGGKFVKGKR